MKRRCHQILDEFDTRLNGLVALPRISQQESQSGIELCHDTLTQLRNLLGNQSKLNQVDEIYFFKEVKPQVMQYLLLFYEVRSCYVHLPRGSLKRQLFYVKERLLGISNFLGEYREFLFYMEQRCTYQDNLYFVRQPRGSDLLLPELMYYIDVDFATPHDVLWARLRAKQLEMEFLKTLKLDLKLQQHSYKPTNSSMSSLHWTGSKTALVELIYALHNAHTINDGQEDISKITAGFERLFDVKLENVYKTYSEIRARKQRRARFLHRLWEGFSRKMEEEDGL